MMSFFSKPNAKKKQKVIINVVEEEAVVPNVTSSFNTDAFHKMIDSQDKHVPNPFHKLSCGSRLSRQRKTKKVNVSVFVTVLSDNPFAPQPYDEERIITVPNKYTFLGESQAYFLVYC